MAVTVQFPAGIEQRLREQTGDLAAEVNEAAAVELFRRGRITHLKLSQMLGKDRFLTDAYLKEHGIYEGSLTMDDLEEDRQTRSRLQAAAKS